AGNLAAVPLARKPRAQELADIRELHITDPPRALPDIPFLDAEDTERRISDFVGHAMVVNFWATWCAPCVAEMPSLSQLARAIAPSDIAVLPLSSDRGGAPVVERFYQEHGIST